jgi:Bacterial Ig-like domain
VNLAPTVPTVQSATTESSPGKARRSTNVTITFSKAMNSATLTNSNVQLFQKGSTKPISSVVTPSSSNTVVTLDPYGTKTTLLTKDTVYTVKVTTAVKDASGTALAATYTKDFRTEDR